MHDTGRGRDILVVKRASPIRIGFLVLNVAIVIYLIWRRRTQSRE